MKHQPHSVKVALAAAVCCLGVSLCASFADKPNGETARNIVYRIGSSRLTHSAFDALAISKDGKTIASVGFGEIKLWNAFSGKLLATSPPKGKEKPDLSSVDFLPRGGIVACSNQAVLLLNPHTLMLRKTLIGNGCAEVCPCPKGHKLAVLRTGKKVAHHIDLVDLRSGRTTDRIEYASKEVRGLRFSPDGKMLAGIADETIVLWNLANAAKPKRFDLKLRESWVTSYAFSPESKLLAVTTGAGELSVWRVDDPKKPITRVKLAGWVANASRVPVLFLDGGNLAIGDPRGILQFYCLSTRQWINVRAHDGGVNALALAPGGKILYSAGADGLIKRWDLRTRKEIEIPERLPGAVHAIAVNPSRSLLAVAAGPLVSLRDLPSGKEKWQLDRFTFIVIQLAFSPDGRYLAASTGHGAAAIAHSTIKIWDVENRNEVFSYRNEKPGHAVPCLRLTDKNLIFLELGDRNNDGEVAGSIQIWDWRRNKRLYKLECAALQMDVSPNGKQIAVARLDGRCQLFNGADGVAVSNIELTSRQFSLPRVLFRGRGKQLVSCTNRGLVAVWNIEKGKLKRAFQFDTKSQMEVCALSPSGRLLAMGGADGQITIWNLSTKQKTAQCDLHDGPIRALGFWNEKRLVSAGADNICIVSAPKLAKQKRDGLAQPLQKLQGTWVLSSFVIDGKLTPSPKKQPLKLTITKDKYMFVLHNVVNGNSVVDGEGKIVVDSSKKPNTIDLISTAPRDAGRTSHGIYELKKDKLKVCFAPSGTDRPRAFPAGAGGKRKLVVYIYEKAIGK